MTISVLQAKAFVDHHIIIKKKLKKKSYIFLPLLINTLKLQSNHLETNTNTQSQFWDLWCMFSLFSVARPGAVMHRTTILALGALSGLWRSVQRKWQGTDEVNNFSAFFWGAPPGYEPPPPPRIMRGGAIQSLSGAGVVMTGGWWQGPDLCRLPHAVGREE